MGCAQSSWGEDPSNNQGAPPVVACALFLPRPRCVVDRVELSTNPTVWGGRFAADYVQATRASWLRT